MGSDFGKFGVKRRPTPPLNTLRAFEVAARHGSFVRAAAELHVTPAAISHRVKELEAALGAELFHRLSQGVEVTETGRRYRKAIARALLDIDRATDAIDPPGIDGPLRVSVSESFAQSWLAPRLAGLAARFPGLELSVHSDNRLADLHDRRTDVGVRFGMGDYPGLDARLLMGDAASVLVPLSWTLRAPGAGAATLLQEATLLEDRAVLSEEPWMGWAPWLREAGVRSGDDGPGRLGFSNTGCAIAACAGGAGACIGRVSLAFESLRERRLHAPMGWRGTDFSYYLVTREIDRDNPRIDAFRHWIVGEAEDFVNEVGTVLGVGLIAGASVDGPLLEP